ncbi:MAG: tRNA pseudouridine(38-40) synthase TruA [Thalassospira sp.]|nr:tRNA pseudouridine(38-40) synthase TruA [Thalassospira sp.]
MPRFKLTLEYDGTSFCGWQKQDNALSVQSALEMALQKLVRTDVKTIAAGRTDAGVHASGQVVHVDLAGEWQEEKLTAGINHFIRPHPVVVLRSERVADTFHARFGAVQRQYTYTVIQRRAPLILERNRAWHVTLPLDTAALFSAAEYLLGTHDFTSFRAINCQAKSPVRTIDSAAWDISGDRYVFHIAARSFLHHQVRNLVGTMVQMGLGRWPVSYLEDIFAAKNRSAAGITAPAGGLCFTRVVYPAD